MKKSLNVFRCAACVLVAVFSLPSFAGEIESTTITKLKTYSSYNNVNYDITVELSTPCPSGGSYYLPVGASPNNEGTKQLYSMLLAAQMAGKSIGVKFNEDKSPNFASATNYCEIRIAWMN